MKFKLVKDKCLATFATRYGTVGQQANRVVFATRYDGKYRIFNANADKMLFDRNGNEIVTQKYLEGMRDDHITVVEATFEQLPPTGGN